MTPTDLTTRRLRLGLTEAQPSEIDEARARRRRLEEERKRRALPMDSGLWGPERDQIDLADLIEEERNRRR